jgi:hypothetical protein
VNVVVLIIRPFETSRHRSAEPIPLVSCPYSHLYEPGMSPGRSDKTSVERPQRHERTAATSFLYLAFVNVAPQPTRVASVRQPEATRKSSDDGFQCKDDQRHPPLMGVMHLPAHHLNHPE